MNRNMDCGTMLVIATILTQVEDCCSWNAFSDHMEMHSQTHCIVGFWILVLLGWTWVDYGHISYDVLVFWSESMGCDGQLSSVWTGNNNGFQAV